jgi:hypothetical protein
MLDYVEARLFEGRNTRPTRVNRRYAELDEAFEGFTNGAAMHTEASGEVSFGGQSLSTSVLAAKDVIAKFRRDRRILRGKRHEVGAPAGARWRSGRTNMARPILIGQS